MRRTAILVIDDHTLFRAGIVAMLGASLASVDIRDASSLDEAMALDIVPTIVLLDVQLRGVTGLEGIAPLHRKWPSAKIVVVSALDTPDIVEGALARGALAFLSKTERPDRMIAMLREWIVTGGQPTTPIAPPGAPAVLTPRQTEVLDLLAQGLSNKMIGRRLGLSEHTVRGHVQAMLATLGVSSRAEAVVAARRLGLVR